MKVCFMRHGHSSDTLPGLDNDANRCSTTRRACMAGERDIPDERLRELHIGNCECFGLIL